MGERQFSIPRIVYVTLLVVVVVVGVAIAVNRVRVLELFSSDNGRTVSVRTGQTVQVYLAEDHVQRLVRGLEWRIVTCPAALEKPRGSNGAGNDNVAFTFRAIQPGQGELVLNLADKDGKVEDSWSVTVNVR